MKPDRVRVFIVDDHPLVREWLGELLRMESDIEVAGDAMDPGAALAAMVARPPDVAIVDLSLKRGSGLDLIKALQTRLPDTRVLVLSMHEDIGDVERALKAGALGYVMKSGSTSQVVQAIRQVYAGRIYADPAVLGQLTSRMLGRSPPGREKISELLSDRELEVFRRLGEGHSTRQIAEAIGVSQNTVQTYCARIKEKIGCDSGTELLVAAIRWRDAGGDLPPS